MSDLLVESIVPAKVVVIRHFWPKSLCRDYVAFLRTLPLVPTPGRPRRGEAVRVNDRLQVDDPLFAARLWQQTGLRDALDQSAAELWSVSSPSPCRLADRNMTADKQSTRGGQPLGLSPNIRVYRYSKGQFFACHWTSSPSLPFCYSQCRAIFRSTIYCFTDLFTPS